MAESQQLESAPTVVLVGVSNKQQPPQPLFIVSLHSWKVITINYLLALGPWAHAYFTHAVTRTPTPSHQMEPSRNDKEALVCLGTLLLAHPGSQR